MTTCRVMLHIVISPDVVKFTHEADVPAVPFWQVPQLLEIMSLYSDGQICVWFQEKSISVGVTSSTLTIGDINGSTNEE